MKNADPRLCDTWAIGDTACILIAEACGAVHELQVCTGVVSGIFQNELEILHDGNTSRVAIDCCCHSVIEMRDKFIKSVDAAITKFNKSKQNKRVKGAKNEH